MAVSFLNSFLSYLVVLAVIAVVGAVAITLGNHSAQEKECSRGKETDRRIIHGKIFGTEIKTFISDQDVAGEHG